MPAIRLTFYAPATALVGCGPAYRIRVEALGNDMDSRVFVYRRGPLDVTTDTATDYFSNVAGPLDMTEIPPDAPDPLLSYPFLRKDFVELDFRSTAQAEAAKTELKKRVAILMNGLTRLADLKHVEEIWYGDPTEFSDSSSA